MQRTERIQRAGQVQRVQGIERVVASAILRRGGSGGRRRLAPPRLAPAALQVVPPRAGPPPFRVSSAMDGLSGMPGRHNDKNYNEFPHSAGAERDRPELFPMPRDAADRKHTSAGMQPSRLRLARAACSAKSRWPVAISKAPPGPEQGARFVAVLLKGILEGRGPPGRDGAAAAVAVLGVRYAADTEHSGAERWHAGGDEGRWRCRCRAGSGAVRTRSAARSAWPATSRSVFRSTFARAVRRSNPPRARHWPANDNQVLLAAAREGNGAALLPSYVAMRATPLRRTVSGAGGVPHARVVDQCARSEEPRAAYNAAARLPEEEGLLSVSLPGRVSSAAHRHIRR